jgi:dihydrofolate reductase
MGRIVISTNITIDGVIEDPTGQEGFAHGGWFEQMSDSDRAAWAKIETEEALAASAMLFGARSYEWFASRWAGREGVWGERLEALTKWVVTSRPLQTAWGDARVLGGTAADGALSVRSLTDGDVLVYGSGHLIGTLLDSDLVDELRLFVFPQILGTGRRLFQGVGRPRGLDLTSGERAGDSLTYVVYRVNGADGTTGAS